jgi:hypothetical protein
MRLSICLAGAVAVSLAGCMKQETPAATANNEASAEANVAAAPAALELNQTSWTFVDKKAGNVQESVDAQGNYIANTTAGKHVDHGTAVMKGDKACFTSAMTKDGESCWTTKPLQIGESMDTVSDKGEKLTVTRVPYVAMTIPS